MPCQSACRPDIHSRHVAPIASSNLQFSAHRSAPDRTVGSRSRALPSLSLSLSLSLCSSFSLDRLNPPLDAALYAALDIRGDPMETLRPDNALGRFN